MSTKIPLRRSTAAIALGLFALLYSARPASAQGSTTAPNPATLKLPPGLTGAQIYATTCAGCHQAQGTGLPPQYPPLAGSSFVTGDERRLILLVLRGLSGEIEVEGEMYTGEMPGWHAALTNTQMASVLTYARTTFGNGAAPITAARVAELRAKSATQRQPFTITVLEKFILALPR